MKVRVKLKWKVKVKVKRKTESESTQSLRANSKGDRSALQAYSFVGIFYSSIGRHAAMMRWRYAGVTPMLRRLLSALMMLSQHLSRL